MKKFYTILILISLLFGCNVFAEIVQTQRKVQPQQTQKTPKNTNQNYRPQQQIKTQISKKRTPNTPLTKNVLMCKPYSETLSTSYMGMDMKYKVSIEGWINNKCRLNFIANVQGVNSSFKELYGVTPSSATIFSYAPKIQCNFTKQQLEYVGDSILQENERNNGATNNMLKNPNDINFNNISNSDQRLLNVVLNQNACTILNINDLNNMIQRFY